MRGVLRKGGPAKIYAGGLSKGTPYVQTAVAPLSDSTVAVSIPGVGYAGMLYVYLAGTASAAGPSWSDGQGGPQGSGETAKWTYQCLGDETSFSLVQTNFNAGTTNAVNSSAPRLAFRINGGLNNGKELRVGSGAASNSWGATGAPVTHAGTTFTEKLTSAALVGYGATRFYNSTIYYSDNTSYGPSNYASYGTATQDAASFNGTTVTANFNYGASSAVTVGSTVFNDPPAKSPYEVPPYTGGRYGNSAGGLALVYLNDQ
jgi:hypothetical protein